MATNALAVKDVLLVPDNKVLPRTFLDALKEGWKFTTEKTVMSIDKRHRHGKVTLTRSGFAKLCVPYTGSVKKGYVFGKPQLA